MTNPTVNKKVLIPPKLAPKKNRVVHSIQNFYDTQCQNLTVLSSGDCFGQKRHKYAFFGCSRFQKFNFVCLLLRPMICSPKTVSIFNFVCPLWTWSDFRIWWYHIYPQGTNHEVESKIQNRNFLDHCSFIQLFHDVQKLKKNLKYVQRSYEEFDMYNI